MNYLYIATFLLIFQLNSTAQHQIKGVEIPLKLSTNEADLELKGAGIRTFMWMNMYVGGIYLQENQKISPKLIEKDQSMGLRLQIISSLVSNKRIIQALEEGFEKGAESGLESLQGRIDQLIDFFKEDIKPGDSIDLIYRNNKKSYTHVYRNSKYLGKIEGYDFKKALFGIWISDEPADEKMKEQILKGI